MPRHIVKSNVREYRDQDTGEVSMIETDKIFTVKISGEEFFQTYVQYMSKFYELEHLSDTKLITKFCELAEFNTGVVSISARKRQQICEELGINTSNFSKYVARLKEKELITGDKGEYMINPAIFWKGEQKVRSQILKEGSLKVMINFERTEE